MSTTKNRALVFVFLILAAILGGAMISCIPAQSHSGQGTSFPTDSTDDNASQTETRTIVCLGDSITYGSGLPSPSYDSWPGRLQDRLGDGWKVANLGVAGATLLDEGSFPYRITGNIEAAKDLEPDVVFIMLGTNDAYSTSWSAERHRNQLRALVREMKSDQPEATIVLMAPPRIFLEPAIDAFGQDDCILGGQIRTIVREVADEEGTHYVDLYAFTEDRPEWFPDQLHPNAEGHRAIGDYVYESVFLQLE